jgi:hypothetical protein
MEAYRTKLAQLDEMLRDALRNEGVDPDWKRKELELLAAAHEAHEAPKKGKP